MRADFWLILAGALLSFSHVHAQECTSLKGIASNHAVLLAGSSDTLWTLTKEEPDRFAVNTISGDGNLNAKITDESKWDALYLCKTPDVHSMSYGAGILVILHDTLKNNFSTFSRSAVGTVRRKAHSFPWSARIIQNDSIMKVSANSVTNDGKWFFFACQDGGVVKWDPVLDEMSMLLPGQKENTLESLKSDTVASPEKRVVAVSVIKDGLLVTTPVKVWRYSFSDSSWDSSITASLNESSYTLKRFASVFSRNDTLRPSLYGLLDVSGTVNEEDSIILCKYDTVSRVWQVLMDKGPQVISFGHGGVVYIVSGNNKIEAFMDTLVSSISERNPRALVGDAVFQDSMVRSFSIEYPEYVNDIMYAPVTDSTGNLWIATSGGLFFSENVSPGEIVRSCRVVKRSPSLASGLEKTYARPGILKSGIYDSKASRTVFIYNLSKDAKVTIRIYDYSMDHVKTVVSGKFRKAGKNGGPMGRSTVEAEDNWDGRNENGKMVAPGVYYYKITADSGERAFGKCIVAK
jgi:hypothetical protein